MYCGNCGTQVDDSMRFCPECGAPIEAQPKQEAPAQPVLPVEPAQPVQPVEPAQPVKAKKQGEKKGKLALIIGAVIGALLIGAALVLLLVVLPEQKRVKRYNEGVDALEAGAYADAEEIFTNLGSYADSEDLLAYAKRGTAYEKAKTAMRRGEYRMALDTFERDPGFLDAQQYMNTCQAKLNLEEANALYDEGEYEEALLLLNELYKLDADVDREGAALAEACRRWILFNEAKALYEQGEYGQAFDMIESNGLLEIAEANEIYQDCQRQLAYQAIDNLMNEGAFSAALDLLNGEAGEGMPNRSERIAYCRNMIGYEEAEKALRNGHNYDAYVAFTALGSFQDAASRAKACIVSTPKTGETYHNGSYNSSSVKLTIKPPSDGTNNYLKIYAKENGKETLVLCAFIRSGDKITVKMPAGTYCIKAAYGYGDWFGETDMFGDSGVYQRLKIDGADSFSLSSGSWELKLRANITDGNVGTSTENRNNF